MVFFKKFMLTKNPNTICWLLEILLIVSQKFKPDESKLEKKLKAEYNHVLDTLLKSAASVVSDGFGLTFLGEYGVHELSLCPTIYELLSRYEFIR